MLKLLLLLCWATIFVSADAQKNVITDNASVPTGSSAGNNVAVNPQLPLTNTKLPVSSSSEDAHVPSQTKSSVNSPLFNLHPDAKTTIPITPDSSDEHNTLTPEPLVTKPTPPTTTTPPTTPKSTTPSTTAHTTAVPTTPPTTPLPPPSTGKWTVKENNTLCIIVQMAAQLSISFVANNVTNHKEMDIPSNSTVTGKCGAIEQNFTLSWNASNAAKDNLTLHFVKNETNKRYSLHHLEISLAPGEFPNNKSNETVTLVHLTPQYEIALSNSYRCVKKQQLKLSLMGKNETVGRLMVSDLQFQAFRSDNTTNFGLAKDCAFDTPDIVPITVGCALAGLVIIVLIAYLVGRRRSQARGYLSM